MYLKLRPKKFYFLRVASCCIILLDPVFWETCTNFICMYLLGASCYHNNRQIRWTGAIACHNSGKTEEVKQEFTLPDTLVGYRAPFSEGVED